MDEDDSKCYQPVVTLHTHVPGRIPKEEDLLIGQLAINIPDKILYVRGNSGVEQLSPRTFRYDFPEPSLRWEILHNQRTPNYTINIVGLDGSTIFTTHKPESENLISIQFAEPESGYAVITYAAPS